MSLFCLLRVLLFALGRVLTWLDKRTERRALVWGSELTSKDAALQGGSIKGGSIRNPR
jgi:hypothetical protein